MSFVSFKKINVNVKKDFAMIVSLILLPSVLLVIFKNVQTVSQTPKKKFVSNVNQKV